jgi:uncharacterized protein (DUF433 family)
MRRRTGFSTTSKDNGVLNALFTFPQTSYTKAVNELDRITINPNQCGGRPCIRGMRIRVKDVLDMLAGGATQEEILQDFPDLEAEDIRACLAYAASHLDAA